MVIWVPDRVRTTAVLYWTAAIALTVFGFIDLIAVGFPFLVLGLALLALGRNRHRRTVFWPGVVGVLAFLVAAILLAPLWCVTTSPPVNAFSPLVDRTECANLVGIDYSGLGNYRPPYVPALVAGFGAAFAAAALTWVLVARRHARGTP